MRILTPPFGGMTRGAAEARLGWIDTARGIGIILVVYAHVVRSLVAAHVQPDDGFARAEDALVYAFHMALFFFLSGLVTRQPGMGGRKAFLEGRIRRIAYPYLLWSIVHGLVQSAAGGMANNPLAIADLTHILWAPIAHFWFLYVLFLCQLLLLLPGRLTAVAATACGMVLVVWFGPGPILLRTCFFLPFFVLGFHLTAPRVAALLAAPRQAAAIAGAAWIVFGIALSFSPRTDADNAAAFVLAQWVTGVAGSIGTIGIARLIADGPKLPALLGRASMPIFLLHPMVAAILRAGMIHAGVAMPPWAWAVLLSVAGLAVPYVIYAASLRFGVAELLGFGPSPRRRAASLGAAPGPDEGVAEPAR